MSEANENSRSGATGSSGSATASLPAAVLWDMDGTLVDTEPYWIRAEHELVAAHGGVWNDEFAHQLVGNALEVSAQLIIDQSGIDLTITEIVEGLLERVVAQVATQVPWRPGARELLFELGRLEVPSLLVTMSWRSLADRVVGALPEGTFRALVTGDEVSHGKPHPEPYLSAARLIDVDPRDCVALEDSPTGVRSATAAGVPTIAIPHVVPVPPIEGAVQVSTLAGVSAYDLIALVAPVRAQR
ncbi:hydrolase [Humibacillus sp. DSM 29435]|uniref:HAD family hydrolase n=1 Tax=Humibacillus sp. DSM 29435 TaxID=1869167 RepID=UPI00087242C6|nr:HAD family phosphatase [Humibacillus sp. DSM 29435]OFE17581.1 hydrolase [Humibacillus sp. DSM 29435]